VSPPGHPGVPSPESPSTLLLVAAFGALYFIWGSTYLAIQVAIETLPPFLMAGVRFVVAGTLLLSWVKVRGGPPPARGEWRQAWITGGLLLAGGNGALVWAEQWIPSGLAALLVASVPLWMVLVDWLWGEGARPTAGLLAGLVWGLFGVGVLVAGQGMGPAGPLGVWAALVVLGGSISWAFGSILSRYGPPASSPGGGIARQMLAGGVLLLGMALVTGEGARFQPSGISVASLAAVAYLVVFGSLVAFSAYIWLLRASTPARVATYAYVNPAVALFLGWALAGEPLGPRTLVASAIVLSAVMWITARSGGRARRSPVSPPTPVLVGSGGGTPLPGQGGGRLPAGGVAPVPPGDELGP
jgi:drug/metabolite transporter (DMT)-like permease